MTLLRSLLGILLFLLLAIPVILGVLVLDSEPATQPYTQLETHRAMDIQEILIQYNPGRLIDTDDQIIELRENDINALLSYYTEQIPGHQIKGIRDSTVKLRLLENMAVIEGSLQIRHTPFGSWLNFRAELKQRPDSLEVTGLYLGSVKLPPALYPAIFNLAGHSLADNLNYQLARSLLSSVLDYDFRHENLSLTLDWQTDNLLSLGDQARRVFISPEQEKYLIAYQNRLAEITRDFPENVRTIRLNDLLVPLFSHALADDSNPQQVNQSIFLVLTCYLTDLDIESLIDSDRKAELDSPRRLFVAHDRRRDLAQHIVVAAAIAATADTELAHILSIYKEVHDSRYGTGFSFSDLTANLVGSGLGKAAVSDTGQALLLQALLAGLVSENDIMPEVDRFDGLSEAEFMQEFGSRESADYQQRLRDIELQASARPVFQALGLQLSFETY